MNQPKISNYSKNQNLLIGIDFNRKDNLKMANGIAKELERAFEIHALNAANSDRFYDISKRTTDIVFSLVLILICLPVFVAAAIIIKIDSPGPVIFKQMRIGKNRRRNNGNNWTSKERRNGLNLRGKPFLIYKLRSMKNDVNPFEPSPTSDQDPRITRSGRLLRKLCIDELPQLINILMGDMSLVGPRPEMPFIVSQYGSMEVSRLLIKPGVTGLWQLRGSRQKSIHENIEHDLEYICNRSLGLDLRILIETFLFMFSSRNH